MEALNKFYRFLFQSLSKLLSRLFFANTTLYTVYNEEDVEPSKVKNNSIIAFNSGNQLLAG